LNSSRHQSSSRHHRPSPAKGARRFPVVGQGNLFSVTDSAIPGSMNDGAMIRAVITEAMKNCPLSRAQIAEKMSRLVGMTVTERQLNNFSADSREEYRFPSELERAFCAVVGDDRLLTCRAEAAGLHVIDEHGWELLELGREFLRQKRAAIAIAQLEKHLEGVEI
jgi:hypothetical protein